MAKPMTADTMTVHLADDTTKVHTGGVSYYAHRHGVDLVGEDGSYVARYRDHEVVTYTTSKAA